MKLSKVTFTGADDSVDPKELVEFSKQYPWVEWGILMLVGGWGGRFPSPQWVDKLLAVAPEDMNLCAHLCGGWVRHLMTKGVYAFGTLPMSKRFQRVQLNFHAEPQPWEALIGLRRANRQFIFQCDGVNDGLIQEWVQKGLGSPLFDVSGGAGVLPEEWPTLWQGVSCGYAGGLGPANVTAQVSGPIKDAAKGGDIWIDMESRVRSKRDKLFDLDKCRDVAEQMAPFIYGIPITPEIELQHD